MTQTPTLAQLLKHAIDNRLLDVHTALIAKVERYNAEKQQVDVAPVLNRRIQNTEGEWVSEQLPVLCDVPVLFPRAGGFFIFLPIKPGDFVQLIFNEVDIEDWLENAPSTIACNERFTLRGAMAIPGVYPEARALRDAYKDSLVLGKEKGLQIHIDDNKIRLGSADAREALAIASKVEKGLQRIIDAFNKHTHTSHGAITLPPMSGVISVAAKNVVAE